MQARICRHLRIADDLSLRTSSLGAVGQISQPESTPGSPRACLLDAQWLRSSCWLRLLRLPCLCVLCAYGDTQNRHDTPAAQPVICGHNGLSSSCAHQPTRVRCLCGHPRIANGCATCACRACGPISGPTSPKGPTSPSQCVPLCLTFGSTGMHDTAGSNISDLSEPAEKTSRSEEAAHPCHPHYDRPQGGNRLPDRHSLRLRCWAYSPRQRSLTRSRLRPLPDRTPRALAAWQPPHRAATPPSSHAAAERQPGRRAAAWYPPLRAATTPGGHAAEQHFHRAAPPAPYDVASCGAYAATGQRRRALTQPGTNTSGHRHRRRAASFATAVARWASHPLGSAHRSLLPSATPRHSGCAPRLGAAAAALSASRPLCPAAHPPVISAVATVRSASSTAAAARWRRSLG